MGVKFFQYQNLGIDYSRYNNTKCSSNDHDWRNCAKSWQKIYVNSIHATFGYCTGFMVSVFVHVVHDENEMQCGYVQEKRMYSRSLKKGLVIYSTIIEYITLHLKNLPHTSRPRSFRPL